MPESKSDKYVHLDSVVQFSLRNLCVGWSDHVSAITKPETQQSDFCLRNISVLSRLYFLLKFFLLLNVSYATVPISLYSKEHSVKSVIKLTLS